VTSVTAKPMTVRLNPRRQQQSNRLRSRQNEYDREHQSSDRVRREELTESELTNVSGGKSGTGKVTFKEFSITKRIDVAMP